MPSDPATAGLPDVRWFAEVDSTNGVAAALAVSGLVVVADHQTAGKGRLGRRWEAPPGSSLLVSVVVDPSPPLAPFAVGLAASDACEDVAGIRPLLKWPNDLVVDQRKVGGILGEGIGGTDAAVLGLGLNVNWEDASPPDGGVSLDQIVGHPVDRLALLAAFLRHLDWSSPEMVTRYRERSATIGRTVRVELGNEVVEGTAVDVSSEGHLLLDSGRAVAAGDVVHVTPAHGSKR